MLNGSQNVLRMRIQFRDPLNIVLLFLLPSRGQQEELHTQFARRMETKVVVATTWLSVGIDISHLIKGVQIKAEDQ